MTTTMIRGANAPLTAGQVTVEVAASAHLDVSALLLAGNGKVRSDADFVFYNAPHGPGVRHRGAAGGAPDAIVIDTAAVPAEIEKVVVTASLDAPRITFATVAPAATVRDTATGVVLATFVPDGLGPETALIVVEVYRRGGAWKVRAVGQGYANGLAGIATDFGITVDDAPQAPQTPAPQTPPPPPVAAPHSPPRLNLDKGRVSLRKQQSVSLVKNGRPLLSAVRMALGWDPAPGGRSIDLDASCIAFDGRRKKVAACWFLKKSVLSGAISHAGDNVTGAGAGDDEVITVDLGRLPEEVLGLVFTVNSFSGQKFTEVANAYCRLVDAASGTELVRFDLSDSQPRTGVMMCKLIREPTGWVMTALGEFADAKTVRGMVDPAAALL